MRIRILSSFVFATLIFLVLLAILWEPIPATNLQQTDDSDIYLPIISGPPLEAIIPHTTNVLTEESNQYLEISATGTRFTYTQNTPELQQVDPGEIIVSDVSEAVPAGYLRMVLSKQFSGDSVIIETKSATLEDAIQQGSISLSKQLSPDDIVEENALPGVSITPSNAQGNQQAKIFSIVVDDVLISGNARLRGNIELDSSLELDFTLEDWELTEWRVVQHTVESANLVLVSEVEAEIGEEVEIARYRLRPIRLQVGVVPIVIIPKLSIYVGANGKVSTSLITSVTQVATLKAGAHYVDGNWNTINEFSNSFQTEEPIFASSLEVKAYAGAGLELSLYTLTPVVPEVELGLNIGLKLETISPSEDLTCWTLKRTLDGQIELEIEVFSADVIDYQTTLFENEATLLAGGNACGKPIAAASITDDTITVGTINIGTMTTDVQVFESTERITHTIPILEANCTDQDYFVLATSTVGVDDDAWLWAKPSCNSGNLSVEVHHLINELEPDQLGVRVDFDLVLYRLDTIPMVNNAEQYYGSQSFVDENNENAEKLKSSNESNQFEADSVDILAMASVNNGMLTASTENINSILEPESGKYIIPITGESCTDNNYIIAMTTAGGDSGESWLWANPVCNSNELSVEVDSYCDYCDDFDFVLYKLNSVSHSLQGNHNSDSSRLSTDHNNSPAINTSPMQQMIAESATLIAIGSISNDVLKVGTTNIITVTREDDGRYHYTIDVSGQMCDNGDSFFAVVSSTGEFGTDHWMGHVLSCVSDNLILDVYFLADRSDGIEEFAEDDFDFAIFRLQRTTVVDNSD